MKAEVLKRSTDFLKDYLTTECYNGATLLKKEAADEQDYREYINLIESLGCHCYAKREEAKNLFADYTGTDSLTVHVSYYPSESVLTVILNDTETALPPKGGAAVLHRVTPLLTQMKLCYCIADCGMIYIIRLCDGRFVIIDSGYSEYETEDRILDVLNQQNEVFERPRIAAWFVSHAHGDHYAAMGQLIHRYGVPFDMEYLVFNWSTKETCTDPCYSTYFDETVDALVKSGTKIITPHTGQRFCFADAVFDVLYACDDYFPVKIENTNDTSTVLRMELCGKRVMFLGDAEPVASNMICKHFPKESVEAEILQVGHHGYGGGSPELYQRINPETLLWPCPDFWYHPVRLWPCNDFLIHSEKIRNVYVEGRDTYVFDMTKPIPPVPAEPTYRPGETIYDQDFHSVKRVIDLGWSCPNGGNTHYSVPAIELTPGKKCKITCSPDANNLVELLRPGLMEDAKSFTLDLFGKLESGCDFVGLIFNYAKPTVFDETKLLTFDPKVGEDFHLELKADETAKKASLRLNGELLTEADYVPDVSGGIYLTMKNAAVTLRRITVVKN